MVKKTDCKVILIFHRDNKNVTLSLSYNIIPNVGRLPIIGAIGSHSFSFPAEYTR
jgi:signal peptidase complex subunit 3